MSKVAPVVGTFRKRVAKDIIGSLTVGVAGAYAFWYGFHVPTFEKYDNFFKVAQEEITKENEAYKKSLGL